MFDVFIIAIQYNISQGTLKHKGFWFYVHNSTHVQQDYCLEGDGDDGKVGGEGEDREEGEEVVDHLHQAHAVRAAEHFQVFTFEASFWAMKLIAPWQAGFSFDRRDSCDSNIQYISSLL